MNCTSTSKLKRLTGLLSIAVLACVATASFADDKAPAPAAPTAVNLALNKTVVSSSPNTHGWNGLTDGSWKAGAPNCYATDMDDKFPKTATIDLGSAVKIGSIVIGVPPFGATKTVEASISTDGTTFKTVGSNVFEQKKEAKYTYSFPATDARYVRLTYKDHYEEGAGFPNFFVFTEEVEVYAPAK